MLKRTPTLLFCLALWLGPSVSQADTPPAVQRAVLGEEAARSMPIADAHFHVMSFMAIGDLVAHMNSNGIRWAGGAGFQGETEARKAEVAHALGKRAIDATGLRQWILGVKMVAGTQALEDASNPEFKAAVESMERELQGGARVIGEIHISTLQSAPMERLRHKIQADAPTLKILFNLAVKYKRPLNVHAQWDLDTAAGLSRLAESNRNGRLVISHCGSTAEARDIRTFFEKNENVLCDLSFRSPPQLQPPTYNRMIFDSSSLRADWKQLIEDYPQRFFVGTDDVHNWNSYDQVVRSIRFGLLANLSPETAEKVAYKNAVALFSLELP